MYTCVSCAAAWSDAIAQRQHYKSEWHRYNLKRRVANMEPLPVDEFERRAEAAKPVEIKSQSLVCNPCSKTFNTPNAFENHVNSKKHKIAEEEFSSKAEENVDEKVASSEDDNDDDWSSYEEITDIFSTDCLFCDSHSKTITKNINHMATAHSFFIPDAEYCTDVKGFLEYLGEKVSQGFMCLWCNDRGRAFYSKEAAQGHMKDKGHCKVLHEGAVLAEYAEFYDYSSSYPDHVQGDEEMEVDAEENNLQLSNNDEEYQLVLPSGAVIGHRSLLRYYKQNLTGHTGALVRKNDDKLKRVICQYRMLGWAPQQSETIAKKAKDIRFMHRAQQKWSAQLGVKANKLQKHFRVQSNY